jgi:hypothetical protein
LIKKFDYIKTWRFYAHTVVDVDSDECL